MLGIIAEGAAEEPVPVLNDATMEDALQAGLDKLGKVIPNGTNIAVSAAVQQCIRTRKRLDVIRILWFHGTVV